MTATGATEQNSDDEAAAGAPEFADILCAVDGTPGSYDSVEQAAALAGSGGHLTLLAVTSFRSGGDHRSPAIGPLRAKEILDRAVGIAAEAHVPTTVEVDPATPPAHVILDWAADHDLLAMGAPTTPWFGGMFTGGATVAALGSLTTPLLIARPHEQGGRFARILVASDGLDGSDELVDLAGRLAQAQQAELTLLHAIGPEAGVGPHRIHEQGHRLQRVAAAPGEVRFEAGSARTVIVDVAEAIGASLVVMSSRRREGLRTIGSVSRRVVHNGHCSVLLVPPEHLHPESTA
jgi:nucleotide-binding universal stress UspA family protein